MSKRCRQNGKQFRPWSDCSSRSSLIWVYTVCPDLPVRKIWNITATQLFTLMIKLAKNRTYHCVSTSTERSEVSFFVVNEPHWTKKALQTFLSGELSSAHAKPVNDARCLAPWLKFPLDLLLMWANIKGFGETAWRRRFAWTFDVRICNNGSFRMM